MALKIRLARCGAKKRPYYKIVVANATAPRDGKFLEKVGTYNPMLSIEHLDRMTLKNDRIAYWLSVGALPTDRVAKFIDQAGIELPKSIKAKMVMRIENPNKKVSKKEAK